MIRKIISGGQCGADIAGLDAGKLFPNITIGGYIPKGFRTEEGLKPEYKELYGLKETESRNYLVRTELNVKNSYGTLIIGKLDSAGCKATRKFCKRHKKPCKHIFWDSEIKLTNIINNELVSWISSNNITILNIAGNRENKNPGIYKTTYGLVLQLLFTLDLVF